MNTDGEPRYRDKEWLETEYIENRRSFSEISDQLGVTHETVRTWAHRHDLDIRPRGRRRSVQAKVRTNEQAGYERIQVRTTDGTPTFLAVHRLAAVAWFGYDAVAGEQIHHKNNIPWDNREENLEPMTRSEHWQHHYQDGDMDFSGLTPGDGNETQEEVI